MPKIPKSKKVKKKKKENKKARKGADDEDSADESNVMEEEGKKNCQLLFVQLHIGFRFFNFFPPFFFFFFSFPICFECRLKL